MMKRSLLLCALLLLVTLTNAQPLKLGFQASPQVSWSNSSSGNIVNTQNKMGISYGLDADIALAGYTRYSLNTGILVTNYSYEANFMWDENFFINQSSFSDSVNIDFKLNYIEIPLNIKLRSDQFQRMTFFGQFGLSTFFNVGASAVSSDGQLTGGNISESINLFNLAMVMGGGVEYDMGGNTALSFGVRYTNGLIDVTTINNQNEKTTLNAVKLIMGVIF